MLALIFLSSLVLVGCNDYPKVTLHQIDTRNNVSNPNKIKEYDKKNCELVLERQAPVPLCGLDAQGRAVMNPYYNGGVYVSSGDYTKVKAKAKADCKNQQGE